MSENETRRVIGINDEQTVCDACGRVELRRTVVIADEDGEIGRYGTTCAVKVLGRTGRGQAAKVLDDAVAAHRATASEAAQARALLAFYADVEDDAAALVARFRDAHSGASWMPCKADGEVLVMARDMFARRRAQVAAAELIGA